MVTRRYAFMALVGGMLMLLGLAHEARGACGVELDIGNVADADEEDPGAFVGLNSDDDDDDGERDFEEDNSTPGEDDLVELRLWRSDDYPDGRILLSLYAGSGVKVWESDDRSGSPIIDPDQGDYEEEWEWYDVPDDPADPLILWVEGIEASSYLRDNELKAEWIDLPWTPEEDWVAATVVDVDLDIDTNDDGTIDDNDDDAEENDLDDDPPGPYVVYNNDDDDEEDTPDAEQVGPVTNEDDLRELPLSIEPDTVSELHEGTIVMTRSSSYVRVWSSAEKGESHKVLYDQDSKTWDLSNTSERNEFNSIKDCLFAEGIDLGDCELTVEYLDAQSTPVKDDNVKAPAVPGPPKLYAGWADRSIIMAGGQMHSQWQHFSKLANQQPSNYKVYIDTSSQAADPFAGRNMPGGLTEVEVPEAVNLAETKGFTKKLNDAPVGAFYIHYPDRQDADGTKYWLLVRAVDATTGKQSQNADACMVEVDYPDRKGQGDTTDRKHPDNLGFYVLFAKTGDDLFFITPTCEICDRSVAAAPRAFQWRAVRAPRRNYGANDTGSYYSDVRANCAGYKAFLEGAGKVFDKTKTTFAVPAGGYTTIDDDKVFMLVPNLLSGFGGYSWTLKDQFAPWQTQGAHEEHRNKSNYSDLLYINNETGDGSDKALAKVSAHELQHNIHGNSTGGDPDELQWINEACSQLSREESFTAETDIYTMRSFQGIPAYCSLSRHEMEEISNRWNSCPFCQQPNNNGAIVSDGHYGKASLWGHYLDKVIGPDAALGYKAGHAIKHIVADTANSLLGVNNHLKSALLQMQGNPPTCAFLNWTIANYCNQFANAPAPYKYTGGWHAPAHKPAVTPYTAAAGRGNYEAQDRLLRNLAADYIRYDHAGGDKATLVITLKRVGGNALWDNLAVRAARQKGGTFVDVKELTTSDVGDERKYDVPGKWGTAAGDDYSRVIIILADLTDTSADAFGKVYNIKATTK